MNNTLKPYLLEHPLFKWLDSRYVDFIASNAAHESFDEGEVILKTGEEAERFYVLVHGEVVIESTADTGDRHTVQPHFSFVVCMDAGDDLHQRRLAGAVFADKAVHFALAQRKIDVRERRNAPERL